MVDRLCFGVGHGAHLGDQRRLAEPLLEDSGGIEQLVVDDGVVHAHAAFVEDAHDGLAMPEIGGELGAELCAVGGQLAFVERVDVREIVRDLAGAEPFVESVLEKSRR